MNAAQMMPRNQEREYKLHQDRRFISS
jgi:hypothetical protein